nr:MAG TPA: hypothetical protein [Caudoviricetes sp.]
MGNQKDWRYCTLSTKTRRRCYWFYSNMGTSQQRSQCWFIYRWLSYSRRKSIDR